MRPRVWVWTSQVVLAGGLVWFVSRAIARNWLEFRSLEVTLQLDPLLVLSAAVTILVTYGALIEAWRRVLRGWGQRLRFGDAARVWCLSNLGRYLPGKVWSLAGLTVLARRVGVSGWAAAGAAVAMQALALGTGACLVALVAPGSVAPARLGLAVLAAGSVVGVLVWAPAGRAIVGILKPAVDFRPMPVGTAALAAAISLASWVVYGLAFWLLAHGMLPAPTLSIGTAVGVFAAGYIVGLVALFAPGGVGVRELIFLAMLTPSVGAGGALAVSVGSRLLLTVTEVGAAVGALAVSRQRGS